MTRVGVITLGCEKNTVDSERYLAQLVAHGALPVEDISDAEVIVINTCGFIDAAKKESLDAIVEAGKQKESGSCRAVVAVGCMVERHRDELEPALPEVDLFLGASEMDRLIPALREKGLINADVKQHPGVRIYGGELPHLRYLKASEGCDHGCAFCAIPLMRGRHRSFGMADIIHEAQLLELQGAREVNLVAQDLAHYGRDVRDGSDLTALLKTLISETATPWYRLLYLYSAGITPRLLEQIAAEPRILSYLDMPMQHGADTMLVRMRRPERRETIRGKIRFAREMIPGIAIRTTCIVGFPGETESEFALLMDFLEEMRFDGVGCFTYSPQEGTRAWELADDVPDEIKRERQERVSELQRALSAEKNNERVGELARVMVDGAVDGSTIGRAWWQAHDIDGIMTLDTQLPPGALADVRITSIENDYDLRGTVERAIDIPGVAPERPARSRQLPLVLASTGAYGR